MVKSGALGVAGEARINYVIAVPNDWITIYVDNDKVLYTRHLSIFNPRFPLAIV
jgi:hypothetical protein